MNNYPVWFMDTNFNLALSKLKDVPDLHFLQIGVYTGDATEWLLKNVLTDDSCTLTDIDTWEGSDEPQHKSMDFNDIYKKYLNRFPNEISSGKLIHNKTTSDLYFESLNKKYDFIYIDGDHHALQAYKDGVNAWNALKIDGILAFDDYVWAINSNPLDSPRFGIDSFLVEYMGSYKPLICNHQYWIQRIK